jgi:hypothetical protein
MAQPPVDREVELAASLLEVLLELAPYRVELGRGLQHSR